MIRASSVMVASCSAAISLGLAVILVPYSLLAKALRTAVAPQTTSAV